MIKLALTKGRIEKKSVELLKTIGYDCSELEDKGRRLIFHSGNLEIVLAKSPDVITYVEHGVCDIGIVGKDTIMEHGGKFYEMLDLGFGRCHFALAGKAGMDFYKGYGRKTVATKYPTVAKNYFASKGIDVEIIKIEGSVELAPLLALSDAIVDIVETGKTLEENGLEVYERITPISARLIANTAGIKIKKTEIDKLINSLKDIIENDKDL